MGGSSSKAQQLPTSLRPYLQQITQEHESIEDKVEPKLLDSKQLKVTRQKYEPGNPFCQLYKAMLITTSEVDVMAVVEPQGLPDEYRELLLLTLVKLANVQDNNVVRVIGCNLSSKQLQVGLEYCDSGTVRTYLAGKGKTIPLKDRLRLCSNLADGLAAVHEAGFVHGEINVDNCFAAEGGYVFKLGPFFKLGPISRGFNQNQFLSPRLKEDPSLETEAADDIWAFGVLLWSIFNAGQPPVEPTEDILELKPELPLLEGMPAAIRGLVDKCREIEPSARPDIFWLRAELADQVEATE